MANDNVTGSLFKEVPPKGYSNDSRRGLANFLAPNEPSTGAISVVNDFPWTLTKKEGRGETPHIYLKEYRILLSALWNSARYYAAGLVQQVPGSKNPFLPRMQGYAGLFDYENPTNFEYWFPYFSETSNEVSSTWATLDILEKIKGLIGGGGAVQKAIDVAMLGYEAAYPRVGIMDRPKLWESSTFRTVNIKFPLYNTVDVKDIQRNWELCYLLLYQNMFNKRDFITAIPPVFYTVYAPGQFFSIAMYVSDLKIYNRGNIRMYQIGNKWRNVPDVYEIDMTLTDMIMPSQNMLAQTLREAPVNVQQLNPNIASPENVAGIVGAAARGAFGAASLGTSEATGAGQTVQNWFEQGTLNLLGPQ